MTDTTQPIIKIGGGMNRPTKDGLDYSFTKVFGSIDKIPDFDFRVAEPLEIKNQDPIVPTDLCVAATIVGVKEDQEKVLLSMEWFFSQIKKAEGRWDTWGADPRLACKIACKIGLIEQKESPIVLSGNLCTCSNFTATGGHQSDCPLSNEKVGGNRDEIANWENEKWGNQFELEARARKHRSQAFFKVDGLRDPFGNMRACMWQNRDERRSIACGLLWQDNWLSAPNGLIDKMGIPTGGHMFKLCGQKNIDNRLYLEAQLSSGKGVGNKGMFYFSREVFNQSFTNPKFRGWASTFKDMPQQQARKLAWTRIQRLRYLLRILRRLLK